MQCRIMPPAGSSLSVLHLFGYLLPHTRGALQVLSWHFCSSG